MMPPPPIPWTARQTTSQIMDWAAPHMAEPNCERHVRRGDICCGRGTHQENDNGCIQDRLTAWVYASVTRTLEALGNYTPMISDSLPYSGLRAAAASKYALAGTNTLA